MPAEGAVKGPQLPDDKQIMRTLLIVLGVVAFDRDCVQTGIRYYDAGITDLSVPAILETNPYVLASGNPCEDCLGNEGAAGGMIAAVFLGGRMISGWRTSEGFDSTADWTPAPE